MAFVEERSHCLQRLKRNGVALGEVMQGQDRKERRTGNFGSTNYRNFRSLMEFQTEGTTKHSLCV